MLEDVDNKLWSSSLSVVISVLERRLYIRVRFKGIFSTRIQSLTRSNALI